MHIMERRVRPLVEPQIQECALSPILFVIFLDRISRRSRGGGGIRFGELRVASLLFAEEVANVGQEREAWSSRLELLPPRPDSG